MSNLPRLKGPAASIRSFILQPNSITIARYHYNEQQENILTLAVDALQGYIKNAVDTAKYYARVVDQFESNMRGRIDALNELDKEIEKAKKANNTRLKNAFLEKYHAESKVLTGQFNNYLNSKKAHAPKSSSILEFDLFEKPFVTISLESWRQKQKYLESIRNLAHKTVKFTYEGKEHETVLFPSWRNIPGGTTIELNINEWAIPYLLDWGKGIGGTYFSKKIALTMPGRYNKRMYKMCRRWMGRGGFSMKIDEFREMLTIPKSYKIQDITRRILDPAVKEMKARAEIYFTYERRKVNSASYNVIDFKILPTNPKAAKAMKALSEAKKGGYYMLVYRIVGKAYSNLVDSTAKDVCDELSKDPEKLEKAYLRFRKLQEEVEKGKKSEEDLKYLVKHILDNDFGFCLMKKSKK